MKNTGKGNLKIFYKLIKSKRTTKLRLGPAGDQKAPVCGGGYV